MRSGERGRECGKEAAARLWSAALEGVEGGSATLEGGEGLGGGSAAIIL